MYLLRVTFFVLLVAVVMSVSLANEAQEFDEGEDITTIP